MLRSMMENGFKDGTHIPGNGYPKAILVPSLFGREFPYPLLGSWDAPVSIGLAHTYNLTTVGRNLSTTYWRIWESARCAVVGIG